MCNIFVSYAQLSSGVGPGKASLLSGDGLSAQQQVLRPCMGVGRCSLAFSLFSAPDLHFLQRLPRKPGLAVEGKEPGLCSLWISFVGHGLNIRDPDPPSGPGRLLILLCCVPLLGFPQNGHPRWQASCKQWPENVMSVLQQDHRQEVSWAL